MQRGGFPAKSLVLALFVVGTVYLLYLYNTTLGRLRDAELSAERYRREEETKVAQLQVARELITSLKGKQVSLGNEVKEVMRSKDELQEKSENDKREFTNRLNSLSQQHKMLKSQYDEHEVEQMRLEQEARRVKEEFQQVETQRNQEFQQLKQQKELEISTLKDQLADAQRQNEQLQSQIANLRTLIQNGESQVEYDQALLRNKESEVAALQQQLANKNAEMQQNLQLQQQQKQQQLGGLQQQNAADTLQFGSHNVAAQQHQPQHLVQQQFGGQQGQGHQQGAGLDQPVANMNVGNDANSNMVGQHEQGGGIHAGMAQEGGDHRGQSQFEQQQQHQQRVEEINEQHQVLPPHNPNEALAHPDSAGAHAHVDGQLGSQQIHDNNNINNNNEEHQVRPPHMKAGGGEEGGDAAADHQLHRPAGEGARGGGEGDEEGGDQHQDPLGLKQMQQPPNMKPGAADHQGHRLREEEAGQQHPPADAHHRRIGGDREEEEEEEEDDQYNEEEERKQNNNVRINPDADFRR